MRYRLPHHIERIERGDKVLFLNPAVPSWIVTNRNGEIILSLFEGGHTIEEVANNFCDLYGEEYRSSVEGFCKKAVEEGLFDTTPRKPVLTSPYTLHTVQLSLSSRCNLHCSYCYATDRREQGGDALSLDEYYQLIDQIFILSPQCTVTLTGGEPLLHKELFPIARYIKERGGMVLLLTNGTLLDEHNIERVKEYIDKVTLSVDGSSREMHERFRGKGSYDKLTHAIQLLQEREIPYSLSMTVSRLNRGDVAAAAAKYGSHLSFAPLFPAGRAKGEKETMSITGREYYETLANANHVTPLWGCEETLDNCRDCHNNKCAIGDAELSISPTGDVYPCQLLHYPEFYIGNIREHPLDYLYHHSPVIERCRHMTVDNIKVCRDCSIRYICGGACRARSYHEGGDIESSSPFCEYERLSFINGIFDLYSHNRMEEKGGNMLSM